MPRTSTPEQDASRKNGRKSQEGRSAESTKRSSHRADTNGLRAQTVALMHEAVEYGQRSDQWHSFYQAKSPAVFHLVNECAR